MGMPGVISRLAFGAHGIRGMERGILAFAGMGPIRRTLLAAR